jgi:hypothetical protein
LLSVLTGQVECWSEMIECNNRMSNLLVRVKKPLGGHNEWAMPQFGQLLFDVSNALGGRDYHVCHLHSKVET